MNQSGVAVSLDSCPPGFTAFGFCSAPPPPPPPVAYSGQVYESSTPDMGSGHDGGVPGIEVLLLGSADSPKTNVTNGGGYFSGSYQPFGDATAFTSNWGLSASGSPSSTLYLYTDVGARVGLTGNSSPDANDSFSLTGTVNGASASMTKAMSPGRDRVFYIPRNPANGNAAGNSTVSFTGIDSPLFTWFDGDASHSFAGAWNATSASGPTGGFAGPPLDVRVMHKWVKLNISFANGTNESTAGVAFSVYGSRTTDATGSVTYSAPLSLPSFYSSDSGPLQTQSNPTSPGANSLDVDAGPHVATMLGNSTYAETFYVHAESNLLESPPMANGHDNELVTLTDADRIAGYKNIKITLLYKQAAK